MKLELIAYTSNIETMIATAMLTTTSKTKPSTLFHKLRKDQKHVKRILNRIEVQHGSIFDHNRLCWKMEATDGEILDILLKNRFFSFTRLTNSKWILSSNLRTAIRYAQEYQDLFGEALLESLLEVAPTIMRNIRRKVF